MKWITLKRLQRDFGLSKRVGKPIIREQCAHVRNHSGWTSILVKGMYSVGVLWAFAAPPLLMPGGHGWLRASLRLPGLLAMVLAWWILPRLLAVDAILAAAKAQVDAQGTGATTA